MSRTSLNVPSFDIVLDPTSIITKLGAGASLYTIDVSQGEPRLVPVGFLPLNDVVDVANSGGKFLEIRGLK